MILCNGVGVAGVNGVVAPSSGGTLTAGYPVQPTTHLATHQLPEHTSSIAPQFAGDFLRFVLLQYSSFVTNNV